MSLESFESLYRTLRMSLFAFLRAAGWPEPTHQQRPIYEDVNRAVIRNEPYYGAVKSGQGVGKTNLEAGVAAWRSWRCFGAPTYVTAPTMRQCKDVFLKELRLNLERGDPAISGFFDVQATRALIGGKRDWGIICLATTKAENFQGIHHDHMTIEADEGSGVPREIFETIFGTLSQVLKDGRPGDRCFLTCGNPNLRDCAFFDFFNKMRARFTTYTLNAEESPIVDQENVRRIIELYGRDSDVYRVRVLGEFPLQDPNCVMNSDDLEACTRVDMLNAAAGLDCLQHMPKHMPMCAIGIDFARYGDDRSVIYRRSGLAIVETAVFSKTEPDVVVAKAFEMQKRAGWRDSECHYVCDADGMGQGIMSLFYRANKRIHEFHNGGRAYNSGTYYDAMTEAMFEMAALSKLRTLHIPDDPFLIQELSTRQYHIAGGVRGGGKIKLESKEEYKRRMGEGSPDKADAAAMVFYPYVFTGARVAIRER